MLKLSKIFILLKRKDKNINLAHKKNLSMKKSTSLQYFSTTPTCSIQLNKNGENVAPEGDDSESKSPKNNHSLQGRLGGPHRGAPPPPPQAAMPPADSHEDVFIME